MTSPSGYAYRAVRPDGKIERGTLAASSTSDAISTLERQGMFAIDVRLVELARERRTSIPDSDLALGLRMLADLLDAGMPVTRALHTLAEVAPASWRRMLPSLLAAVQEGKSLGAALRDAPAAIPPLVIGMTLAGEVGGNVGAAIRRAAELTESVAHTRAAVRAALAYPVILALTGTGTIALMVGVVIPRFAAILADLGQSLPLSTRMVMRAALLTREAFLPAFVVLLLLGVGVRAWVGTERGRRSWHGALLRTPLIGTIRRASATARSAFTLATLLETGVPIRSAIPFAARASGDAEVAARIIAAGSRVESGHSIGQALRETDAFTPLAVRLTQAGEQSGHLASMLKHAAKLEQERSERIMRAMVRLLEPALILVFAGVVALVAAALLQAVYAVRPTA